MHVVDREVQTWVASGGAGGTIDDVDGVPEDGREREGDVEAASLELAVHGSQTARYGTRWWISRGGATVIDAGRCHCKRNL